MAGNPYLWSTTALTNTNADSDINWAEGQLPGTVNGSARGMMAGIAGWLKDTNGTITTGGAANAYTATANVAYAALAQGLRLTLKANHSNTGAATLVLTPAGGAAFASKALRVFTEAGDTALSANMIRSGGHYEVEYDTAADGAAGAWLLLNPSLPTISTFVKTVLDDANAAAVRATIGAGVGEVASVNGLTGAVTLFGPPQGRLTLSTGVPVLISDVTAAGTIYYTPCAGDMVPIYDGTNMVPTTFTELSQALSDTTKSPAAAGNLSQYDLFVWNDGGTIRCTRGPVWTDGTTRSAGTALTLVKGIYLNNASITNGPAASRGTYVGTIRTNGSGTVDFIQGGTAAGGTSGAIFLWNAYNRRQWRAQVNDSTDSWSYTTTTIRAANGASTMLVDYVTGLSEGTVAAVYHGKGSTSGNPGRIGVGFNSTTAFSGTTGTFSASTITSISAHLFTNAGLGRRQIFALERGASGCTFYGDNADATIDQTGLHASGDF